MKDVIVERREANPLSIKIHITQMSSAIILLVIAVMSYYSANNHLMFIAATITSIYVIFNAKVSFFSVFTFILWFSFVQEYVASINKFIAASILKKQEGSIEHSKFSRWIYAFVLRHEVYEYAESKYSNISWTVVV